MPNFPLDGVRVLDLSSVVVGPYATQFLADYGADVTKIEAPGGDILRKLGGKSKSGELSPKFMMLNRNKKSLAIDLKNPAAKPLIAKLLAAHDVVLSNIRPRALARLGLDYESARAIRPDVIYCSIVGFGQEGRYKDKPAYDNVIQGVGGIAACHERQSGTPRFLPMVLADRLGGLMATQAILLAVINRSREGEGQHIEIPMFENTAAFVLTEHFGQLIYPGSDGPSGDLRVLDKNARPIQTKDGYICLSANSDKQAFALFEAIGLPELKDDPRFDSVTSRYHNIDSYNGLREEHLQKKTTAEWIEIFERLDVPAMPYKTFEDLVADPHLNDVGLYQERDHPSEGKVYNLRPVATFSSIGTKTENLAPRLGEHSADVLASIGVENEEIESLISDGVILDRPLDG
jgi:crotonobetainyl-CoA:carnitine CoA-transferase CaiB-like acyl-CoA transferase